MRDANMIFSLDQAETASGDHVCTNLDYIDLKSGHTIGQDWHKLMLYVTVGTAFTSSSETLIVTLQDATAYGGTYYATCIISGARPASTLTAGAIILACPLPYYGGGVTSAPLRQFIRVLYTISAGGLTTGTLNAWLEPF